VRGVALGEDLNEEFCREILQVETWGYGTRGIVTQDDEKDGLNSYVLLAACRSGQKALEIYGSNGGGAFTSTLLKVLTETDISGLTYKDLMKRVREAFPYKER